MTALTLQEIEGADLAVEVDEVATSAAKKVILLVSAPMQEIVAADDLEVDEGATSAAKKATLLASVQTQEIVAADDLVVDEAATSAAKKVILLASAQMQEKKVIVRVCHWCCRKLRHVLPQMAENDLGSPVPFRKKKTTCSHICQCFLHPDPEKKPREIYIPPPPPEDEDELFKTIEAGINFDKYDDIPVKCTGDNPPRALKS